MVGDPLVLMPRIPHSLDLAIHNSAFPKQRALLVLACSVASPADPNREVLPLL